MPSHAAAQLIGGRDVQCDATAVYTSGNARAYALLDGIGDVHEVQAFAKRYARRLAEVSARQRDAEVGLRIVHGETADLAEQRPPWRDPETAVAVVALHIPGELLQVAWCGDARAYVLDESGELLRLTTDHNGRQQLLDMGLAPGPDARHTVTSYLGDTRSDPKIGTALGPAAGRLLLASDGAYEPLEDSCRDLTQYLTGTVHKAADAFVRAAIDHGPHRPDNATVLIADLFGLR